MMSLSQNQILYGSKGDLPQQIPVRAGALTAFFEDGTLRHIKLGDTMVVHQVYAALRDHNWDTIAGELSDLKVDAREDAFEISFTSHHLQDHIDFVWQGNIKGDSSGTIRFHFDGQANSTFERNRLGFCILHPAHCAGQACTVEQVDGSETKGVFPQFISPHQPFFDIRAITHQVDGVAVRVLMEGDTFEMEDQRNWTDSSYKTYCTPLGLPFPVTVSQGERVVQTITISTNGEFNANYSEKSSPITLQTQDKALGKIPPIGLCISQFSPYLSDLQVERLSALRLNHLRVDVKLQDAECQSTLKEASEQAQQLNCQLEVALHLTDDAENQLIALKLFAKNHGLDVARWIIFHTDEKSTSRQWVELARQYLHSVPIGAGTNAFFTELNRERPPNDVIDFAVYSLNPQVHAFDNSSLVETLPMQAETVTSARQFCDDKPAVVSPITFKMRFNPNATGEPAPIPDGGLPTQVDERQMSLFGACWTLGSLKYILESQVESVTYYETVGWCGLMATSATQKYPDKFPSIVDSVFPMYHVFKDVGELAQAQVIKSKTTNHLIVDSLILMQDEKLTILLANMTPKHQTIQLNMAQGQYAMRRLNHENAIEAMTNPETYRFDRIQEFMITAVSPVLNLSPYEYIRLQQV